MRQTNKLLKLTTMKATAKQIFNEIARLNPQYSNISSLGDYVSESSKMIADSIYKEVYSYLSENSLAYKILTNSERYSEKQLWVISFELEKNERFNEMISERISRREAKTVKKVTKSKVNKGSLFQRVNHI